MRLNQIWIAIGVGFSTQLFAQVSVGTVEVTDSRNTYVVRSVSAATRTDTPVENIPQTIVSLPRDVMDDQGSKTLSDALRNVSNVTEIDPRDSNNAVFKIRGFQSSTIVDGVAMPASFPNFESLHNVEQIDVIKGPAGGLYGSGGSMGAVGSFGGSVVLTTFQPEKVEIRKVGVTAGAYGFRGTNFDLNQPINKDLALRVTGEVSKTDSETNKVFFKKIALSPSLAWEPDGATKVVLRLRYADNTTLDYSGIPAQGTILPGAVVTRNSLFTATGLPDTTNNARGVNLQWTQKLNDEWKFGLIIAQNKATYDQRGVWAWQDPTNSMGMGVVAHPNYFITGYRMFDSMTTTTLSPSITGRFFVDGIGHTLNAGVDVERTTDKAFMRYSDAIGILGMANIQNDDMPAWVEPSVAGTPDLKNTYKTTTTYVQDQVDIGRLHLTGALRYSQLRMHDQNTYDDTVMFMTTPYTNSTKANKVTPRLGASYELTNYVSSFIGYSEAVKVPIWSVFATPPKPEEARQKEIGFKFKEYAGVSGTVALYDLTRKNAPASVPGGLIAYQVGEQQSKGFDADLRWRVTPTWTLLGAYAVQTTETTENSKAPTSVGKQLRLVPKQTLRLASRYDIRTGDFAGLGLGLGLTHIADNPYNTDNSVWMPSVSVWDAQMSYTQQGARYGVSVVNLTNKNYYMPSAFLGGGSFVTPAAPRTIMATAQFTF